MDQASKLHQGRKQNNRRVAGENCKKVQENKGVQKGSGGTL